MKKLFLLLITLIFSVVLVACGGETDNSSNNDSSAEEGKTEEAANEEAEEPAEEEATEEEEASEPATLSVGDSVEVDGVKFILKGVSTTDERNEFADTDPTHVVKIEYEIENNSGEEISVGGDLQVYDATGNQMEPYPLDSTLGSLQPGKKIQGVDYFGVEEGPIEIYFQPLFSFEDPAIFTADIE